MRSLFLLSLALSFSAHASDLKPSRLDCTVKPGGLPNYTAGSKLHYDPRSDEITSSGFLSNIVIRHPKLVRGGLGNVGISGEGFAQGPFGLFPFDSTIEIAPDDIWNKPITLRAVDGKLLTAASQMRLGSPDAELVCDVQLVLDN